MCDIAKEKHQIDALLERAADMAPMRDCVDENALTDFGLRVLREYYSDACPDECLRQRCMEFAACLARRRKAERWLDAAALRRGA